MASGSAKNPAQSCCYVSVGAQMFNFAIDEAEERLQRRGAIQLPSRVRYAWPHPKLPILYAACGNGDARSDEKPYHLCAMWRDEAGDLTLMDAPVALPFRPIHVTTDDEGRRLVVTYGGPSAISVHELNDDGTVGKVIPEKAPFDLGSTAHQARVLPSGNRAIVISRGMKGFDGPGYIEGRFNLIDIGGATVDYVGHVAPSETAPIGGFNPRHLDFHPTRPFVFVALEGQNQLCVFRRDGENLDPTLLFARNLLEAPENLRPRQDAGGIHAHPNGRFVYVANRNDGCVGGHAGASWLNPDPIPIFPGGENNIAVFAIDQATGEPTLIQNADTHGLHPRAFGIDRSGRFLVAGNYAPTRLATPSGVIDVPANLALFRVEESGRLIFLHRYDLDVGPEKAWWTGVVG